MSGKRDDLSRLYDRLADGCASNDPRERADAIKLLVVIVSFIYWGWRRRNDR
jgi:hypothetical protein